MIIIYSLIFFTQIFQYFSLNISVDNVRFSVSDSDAASYETAAKRCLVDNEAILAVVKDYRVQELIYNETRISNETNFEYYIGLKYIAKENFVWENGIFSVPNLIWDEDMPEVKDNACVFMTRSGKMSMGSCFEKRRYICSNDTKHYFPEIVNKGYCQPGFFRFLNYCYKMNFKCSDMTYTWSQANTYCKSLNSTLLVIDSFVEQDFISTLMTISPQPSWIGLIHKNISKHISIWIDNTTNTVPRYPIRFKSGEPNGYRTNEEHCVMVYNRLSNIGYFNDEVCNKSLNYICKSRVLKNDSDVQKEDQLPNPLYKRGKCKEDYYEFNETCFYLKHLRKSYKESNIICKNKTLEIYNNIHIAFIRSLMSNNDIDDVWISIFNKDGKINGAACLINETSKGVNFVSPNKCYTMSTQQGIGIAKSCDLKNIATACYYYLDGHEAVTNEFICPNGWIKAGLKCFKVFQNYVSFSEASIDCNKTNSKLATLTNLKEVQAVDSMLRGNAWIGMNGESFLRNSWIDGTSIDYCLFRHTSNLTVTSLTNPNHVCFVVRYKKGEWDDKLCSDNNDYVCEMPGIKTKCTKDFPIYIDGDCYGNFNLNMSWLKAEQFCQRKGGNTSHLTSFHSLLQENDVFSQINDLEEYWIGMKTHDFRRMWIDGSIPNYLRYYTNFNPDNSHFTCFTSQRVNSKSESIATRWNLDNCELNKKFICKVSNVIQNKVLPDTSNIPEKGFCPQGFFKFKKSCFMIVNETATWSNAAKLCRHMEVNKVKVRLASFRSKEEFEFVLSKMRDFSSYIWIGLYSDDKTQQYVWLDETPLTFVNFADYLNSNFPMSGSKGAMFVSSHPFKNGYWRLIADLTNLPYICRTDAYETSPQNNIPPKNKCPSTFNVEYNGYCYYYHDVSLPFPNAYDYCVGKGSDILVINDTFEEQFIKYFLYDKSRNNKLIWMGFRIDASISMLADWVTPKKVPIYYTHWKDVKTRENDNIYTDFNPQSKIHGCYTFNFSSNFNIFNEIDHTLINNAMILSSCDISIPFVCKVAANKDGGHVSDAGTCAKSRNNVNYDLRVTKTMNRNPCIRWDIVKTSNTLDYHLQTFLYSSIPFNKDGYVSYSLNRCSELNINKQELGYSCYIFKEGKYLLEACKMLECDSTHHKEPKQSSSKTILVLLFVFTFIIVILTFLFMLRKRILSNYRFRSFMAHVLGRYQPDWIGDSNRAHTSPGGGVGFTNPVYTPLDNEVNMAP